MFNHFYELNAMENRLDYFDQKYQQFLLGIGLFWLTGIPLFMKEIGSYATRDGFGPYFLLFALIIVAFLAFSVWSIVKLFPLYMDKKLQKQLFDEYAKANHYKAVKIASVVGFVSMFVMFQLTKNIDVSAQLALGICLYMTGSVMMISMWIFNRK